MTQSLAEFLDRFDDRIKRTATRLPWTYFGPCTNESPRGSAQSTFDLHCKPRHAVRIEPSLQPRSLENGNNPACGRRLSAFSP